MLNEQEKLALALALPAELQQREALIARSTRLEGIFLPHARRRRDELYAKNTTGFLPFVHYTSAEAALHIIREKRLWMRSAACMADYREVQHGFQILQKFFSDSTKARTFIDLINSFALGAAHEAIANFDHWWSSGNILHKTYITSMSEHSEDENLHGRLSMWRAFGGNGARVGIVFSVPKYAAGAEAMKLMFSPVAYLSTADADNLVPEVMHKIQENLEFLKPMGPQEISNWIFQMFLATVTCTKHPGFREEKEWRAVHHPLLLPTDLLQPSTETIGGVPQVVYNLPIDGSLAPVLADLDFSKLFNRLIIGPTQYPVAIFDAFADALSKAGVADAGSKIFASDIPIRSA